MFRARTLLSLACVLPFAVGQAACRNVTQTPAASRASDTGLPEAVPRAPADGAEGDTPAEDLEGIVVRGRRVLVDGEPLFMRGVCWNPVGRGDVHPQGLDFAAFAAQDVPLMQELGVNVVRTYEPLLDEAVLDRLFEAGIYVLNSVYPYGGATVDEAVSRVRRVASHPAVLMWVIGNEWNYNGLYAGLTPEQSLARVAEVSATIKSEDSKHPVVTVYGELPSPATIAALPDVDVWGINSYRGIGFGRLFDDWASLSGAPMFLSEYGADAYDARDGAYDPDSQAEAVAALTREIVGHASAFGDTGVALGGTIFEWADEWWKDASGTPDQQDVGGIAPGGGPFPDSVFNEEWWGLLDIDRNPRPAYDRLREVFSTLGG